MKRGSDWNACVYETAEAAVTKVPFCTTARVGIAGSADPGRASGSVVTYASVHIIIIQVLYSNITIYYILCSHITLLRHFDFIHSDQKFDAYYCAQGECSRSFYLRNSYIKHLVKHRTDLVQISLDSQVLLENNILLESTATTNANCFCKSSA